MTNSNIADTMNKHNNIPIIIVLLGVKITKMIDRSGTATSKKGGGG